MDINDKLRQLEIDAHGKEITLDQANVMINEFLDLNKIIDKSVRNIPDRPKMQRATELKNGNYNAFVFHRSLIERFFDGSLQDEHGNPQKSEYLMVLLGAHRDDEPGVKGGSSTVITVGTNLGTKTQSDGTKEPGFYSLNTAKPANEYPPRYAITSISVQEESTGDDKGKIFFKVID